MCVLSAAQPWLDASLPVDVRVEALMGQLNNTEKNAQLSYGTGAIGGGLGSTNATITIDGAVAVGGVGGIGCSLPANQCAAWNAKIQAGLKDRLRVWVPAMQMCETTHTGGVSGTTLFPMPVVIGQSWNISLMEEIGREQGLQARAGGCSQALSPVLQVTTDPRFGRLAENFGEDPHMVSMMGLAALRGTQGHGTVAAHGDVTTCDHCNASTYIADPLNHPFCQAKHYAGCEYKPSFRRAYLWDCG
jgi:beta-glucosidase-like glycosyl hydrolase